MAIMRWDPFRDMVSLREMMNRLFDDSFLRSLDEWSGEEAPARMLALDVDEKDNEFVVKASLPGIKPEDVDISVMENVLTIKGQFKQEKESDGQEATHHLRERYYGSFQRTLSLPAGVDAGKAEAHFEEGVLTLTLPKVEDAKPKRIEVKAK